MLRGVSFVSLRKRIRIRNSIVWEAQSSGCLPGTFFNAVLNSTLNNPLSWLCIPEPESQGITFERCKPCILVSSTFAFHVEGTQQIFDTKISPYGLAEDPFLICGWWPTTCLCSSLLQNLLFSWNLHFDLINDFLLHFNEQCQRFPSFLSISTYMFIPLLSSLRNLCPYFALKPDPHLSDTVTVFIPPSLWHLQILLLHRRYFSTTCVFLLHLERKSWCLEQTPKLYCLVFTDTVLE